MHRVIDSTLANVAKVAADAATFTTFSRFADFFKDKSNPPYWKRQDARRVGLRACLLQLPGVKLIDRLLVSQLYYWRTIYGRYDSQRENTHNIQQLAGNLCVAQNTIRSAIDRLHRLDGNLKIHAPDVSCRYSVALTDALFDFISNNGDNQDILVYADLNVELSLPATCILSQIMNYCEARSRPITYSYRQWAKRLGVNVDQVYYAIGVLKKNNWIHLAKHRYKGVVSWPSNTYYPDWVEINCRYLDIIGKKS